MRGEFEKVRAIKDGDISAVDIVYVEADINYTILNLKCGKKLMLAKTLKQWSKMLQHEHFIRPSRSHLVNVKFLKSVTDTHLVLSTEHEVEISRSRRPSILRIAKMSGFGDLEQHHSVA